MNGAGNVNLKKSRIWVFDYDRIKSLAVVLIYIQLNRDQKNQGN